MLPERKSFPPRTVITIAGTLLAFTLGCLFVIGAAVWRKSESAEKQLATEIWGQIAARSSASGGVLHTLIAKIGGRNGSNGRAA